eukprot:m.124531 g.124531  ORF g.124531 m.124531 type:complete len:75 (-) comp9425_c11_seq1:988-1212(-)
MMLSFFPYDNNVFFLFLYQSFIFITMPSFSTFFHDLVYYTIIHHQPSTYFDYFLIMSSMNTKETVSSKQNLNLR